ncbi:metastasis-associated protein MTA1-like isoform X2 [Artemia franciscana]
MGAIEAKVMCFYRRRDIPSNLLPVADRHQDPPTTEIAENGETTILLVPTPAEIERSSLPAHPKHLWKHRELFLSRQVESVPASHIRGKCSVALLNEEESCYQYINAPDVFFYSLVFDPVQKTLLADKGEIRTGNKYQCEVPDTTSPENRNSDELETLVWSPYNQISDRQIDQFLILARSVGTFARALDCSNSVKQPSLHMSAAAASRDITLEHALDILHKHGYDMGAACGALVPTGGPILCRDEIEEWSSAEAALFEEAMEKYGKDFIEIRQDFLPWKTVKNVVEYYYMWKTTDRYVQQKRGKAVEAESKLKQVYIPTYFDHTKGNPAVLPQKAMTNGSGEPANGVKACESCGTTVSPHWFAWGVANAGCQLCIGCWDYWKRYSGLLTPSKLDVGVEIDIPDLSGQENYSCIDCKLSFNRADRLASHLNAHRQFKCTVQGCFKDFRLRSHLMRHCLQAHGITMRSSSPRPAVKTRSAFLLSTTPLCRLARRLCKGSLNTRKAGRTPFLPLPIPAIKQESQYRLNGKSMPDLQDQWRTLIWSKRFRKIRHRGGKILSELAIRLARGHTSPAPQEWLKLPPRGERARSDKVLAMQVPTRTIEQNIGTPFFDRVPSRDGSRLTPVSLPPGISLTPQPMTTQSSKRRYEETSPADNISPVPKRLSREQVLPSAANPLLSSIAGLSGSPLPPSMLGYLPGLPPGLLPQLGPGMRPMLPIPEIYQNLLPPVSTAPLPGGLPVLPSGLLQQSQRMPPTAPIQGAPMKLTSEHRGSSGHRHHSTITRIAGSSGRKQVATWMDAPDDLFFKSSPTIRRQRRMINPNEAKRCARKPWRNLPPRIAAVFAPLLPSRAAAPVPATPQVENLRS